jgi:hypothetical protein
MFMLADLAFRARRRHHRRGRVANARTRGQYRMATDGFEALRVNVSG